MRQWLVDPTLLCQKHLLGEHLESHMIIGTMRKGWSIEGYITGGYIDPRRIISRHDELVNEMLRRGMNHKSPMKPEDAKLIAKYARRRGKVSIATNLTELARRCPECRARQVRKLVSPSLGNLSDLQVKRLGRTLVEVRELLPTYTSSLKYLENR